jgi:hypothetical protein
VGERRQGGSGHGGIAAGVGLSAAETSLAVKAMVVCIWFHGRRRPYASGVFNGLEMMSLMAPALTGSLAYAPIAEGLTGEGGVDGSTGGGAASVGLLVAADALMTVDMVCGNVVVMLVLVLGVLRRSGKQLSMLRSLQGHTRGPSWRDGIVD